jgi:hypothetical protein
MNHVVGFGGLHCAYNLVRSIKGNQIDRARQSIMPGFSVAIDYRDHDRARPLQLRDHVSTQEPARACDRNAFRGEIDLPEVGG